MSQDNGYSRAGMDHEHYSYWLVVDVGGYHELVRERLHRLVRSNKTGLYRYHIEAFPSPFLVTMNTVVSFLLQQRLLLCLRCNSTLRADSLLPLDDPLPSIAPDRFVAWILSVLEGECASTIPIYKPLFG